jgi:hypothetical protein
MKNEDSVILNKFGKEYSNPMNKYEFIGLLLASFLIILIDGIEIIVVALGINQLFGNGNNIIIRNAIIVFPILIILLNLAIILFILKFIKDNNQYPYLRDGLKKGIFLGSMFIFFIVIIGIIILLSQPAIIIDPCACY